MDKLLSSINTRINYIKNNTENPLLLKEMNIIDTKLQYISYKTYDTEEGLNTAIEDIVRNVNKLKSILGQTNMVYKKMDELIEFVKQIPELYFVEQENTEDKYLNILNTLESSENKVKEINAKDKNIILTIINKYDKEVEAKAAKLTVTPKKGKLLSLSATATTNTPTVEKKDFSSLLNIE